MRSVAEFTLGERLCRVRVEAVPTWANTQEIHYFDELAQRCVHLQPCPTKGVKDGIHSPMVGKPASELTCNTLNRGGN